MCRSKSVEEIVSQILLLPAFTIWCRGLVRVTCRTLREWRLRWFWRFRETTTFLARGMRIGIRDSFWAFWKTAAGARTSF